MGIVRYLKIIFPVCRTIYLLDPIRVFWVAYPFSANRLLEFIQMLPLGARRVAAKIRSLPILNPPPLLTSTEMSFMILLVIQKCIVLYLEYVSLKELLHLDPITGIVLEHFHSP